MPPSQTLVDAYGWFRSPNGAALYASPSALRRLAEFVREGSDTDILLAAPPTAPPGFEPVHGVRVSEHRDGAAPLRVHGHDIEIAGGLTARDHLASTLENLADSPPTNTSVTRHVDLAYFPGHGFLSEDSMWTTVYQHAGATD